MSKRIADSKQEGGKPCAYKLELVGLATVDDRPDIAMQVLDRKNAVLQSQRIDSTTETVTSATLHLEAHCTNGSNACDCKMKVDIQNPRFDPGGSGGSTSKFKTPQTFRPGLWIITLATLTAPGPFIELSGVPITLSSRRPW